VLGLFCNASAKYAHPGLQSGEAGFQARENAPAELEGFSPGVRVLLNADRVSSLYAMWNLGNRKSFLLARSSRADRVGRGHPTICSSVTSNRRFIWLVTLSFTLFAGIGAHRLQAIPMPAPGSFFSLIAVWPTTRSMPNAVA
jgi:hypothetical protein